MTQGFILFKSGRNKTVVDLLHEDVGDDSNAEEQVEQPEEVEDAEDAHWQDRDTWTEYPTRKNKEGR